MLKITDNGERWHYLVVRSLSALLRGISSSNNGDCYCLNCFHSYRTLNKLKKHERICNNHDYCCIDMPKIDDTKKKRYFYRGKNCIEKFCKDSKELGTEMINFKKKEMIPLTNKEIKSYEKQKVCHICKKKLCYDKKII